MSMPGQAMLVRTKLGKKNTKQTAGETLAPMHVYLKPNLPKLSSSSFFQ
jgi:hypothetical protein